MAGDVAEQAVDAAAEEAQRHDGCNGDQREDQRVLHQRLTFLAREPCPDVCEMHVVSLLVSAGSLTGADNWFDPTAFDVTPGGLQAPPAKGLAALPLWPDIPFEAAADLGPQGRRPAALG